MRTDLMSKFESLGDNCEFGLLQRAHGVEYSNILRWSYIFNNEALLQLMEEQFKNVFRYENLTPRGGGDMVDDKPSGIAFHSALKSKQHGHDWCFTASDQERRRIHTAETSKIRYLVQKTSRAFAEADRIFVFKNNNGVDDQTARALLAQLRKYNSSNQLVYLVLPQPGFSPGDVEEIEPGLFKGCLDRFAPYNKANDVSEAVWIDVLEKVSARAATELAPTRKDTSTGLSVRQAKCDTTIGHKKTPEGLCNPLNGIAVPAASVLVATYVAVHGDLMELSDCTLNGEVLPHGTYFVTNAHWEKN